MRANQPSSSTTFTPSSSAFFSFEPAPGTATTRSVFEDTDPETLAPSRSAIALASSRVIFSNEPVKTTVLPATGLSDVSVSESAGDTCSSNRPISSKLCGSLKNWPIASRPHIKYSNWMLRPTPETAGVLYMTKKTARLLGSSIKSLFRVPRKMQSQIQAA